MCVKLFLKLKLKLKFNLEKFEVADVNLKLNYSKPGVRRVTLVSEHCCRNVNIFMCWITTNMNVSCFVGLMILEGVLITHSIISYLKRPES